MDLAQFLFVLVVTLSLIVLHLITILARKPTNSTISPFVHDNAEDFENNESLYNPFATSTNNFPLFEDVFETETADAPDDTEISEISETTNADTEISDTSNAETEISDDDTELVAAFQGLNLGKSINIDVVST